jgi:hypothetical protein
MISDQILLQLKELPLMDDQQYLQIARNRYIDGLNLRSQYVTKVCIRKDGCWSVRLRYSRNKKGFWNSSEKIGTVVGSNAFYQGILDSMIELVDQRKILIAN